MDMNDIKFFIAEGSDSS